MTKEKKNGNGTFARVFEYVKNNFIVGYSLLLLFLIPAAFFANNYLINTKYNKAIDNITRLKAILAEDILNSFIRGQISDSAALQPIVERVARDNEEILSLTILRAGKEPGVYEIIASNNPNEVGKTRPEDAQIFLARNNSEGVALLDETGKQRFWKVVKTITGPGDVGFGFVEMSVSLAGSDITMNEAINYSYGVLALMVLVLVLLLANQTRLLEYALSLNKLKELDRMKDMFISMASHELRAPLTAMKGYLELFGDRNPALDAESARYLQNITASSKRLEELVEDMLEVSRIEGNRFPIEIAQFDPYPLIEQSVEEMRSQAIQKYLELSFEKPRETAVINADANRVKQVVVNLIGNALKYTEKGLVKVTASPKRGEFLITVADTGIGISSEEQANLFQKFYRAKNEQTKMITGTGLGLWITAETVKRMKGKITVESIEGVGSHFTVHLPLAK
jgi:signal transduction histidine kinase